MTDITTSKKVNAVVFYSYPKLLFAWPLIAIGILFWFVGGALNQEMMAWMYLLTTVVVLLTVGVDLERNHSVFWLAVFLGFFFMGMWLSEAKHFTLFGDVYRWFANRDIEYDPDLGFVISVFLAIPYAVMLIWTRLQHKWRITHNEFEHYSFGRSDDSLARGAKRVRSTYPDLLELLICGAGTLIVYSATGRSELRRIPHVPLLPLLRKRINHILEMTAVTTTDAVMDEELEEEEGESGTDDQGAVEGSEGSEVGSEEL